MSLYIVCNASGMLRASAITSSGKGSLLAIWRDLCIYKYVARQLALVGAHAWSCTPHVQVGVVPVGAVQVGQ